MSHHSADWLPLPAGVPAAAHTDPREVLYTWYSIAEGRFNPNFVITIKGIMYDLGGQKVGTWEGVDAPIVPDGLFQALVPPPDPVPPFNEPVGPVAKIPVQSWSKGRFRALDGSTLEWIGPAAIRVVGYQVNPTAQLWISGNQIIVEGTGRFEGWQGLKTVGGAAIAPDAKNLTAQGTFRAKTVESFRLVPRKFQGKPPGAP